ncbi:WD40 repeat-like protein [Pluteus cervinus]|uniref:WD40 repeat-like protein n=1 Tax=Pluteus cervinus TaxID=181527 RepID=A0ACD3B8U0_9AGAR|nr:WD40 repeat-like protein [Pluteus cervinus]
MSVSYNQEGKNIISGSCDKTIRIWNATGGEPVMAPLQGHTDSVLSVAYSPDDDHVVSGSADKTIKIWNAATGQLIIDLPQAHADWVRSVAYSPDGKCIISGSHDNTIRIWDPAIELSAKGQFQNKCSSALPATQIPNGQHPISELTMNPHCFYHFPTFKHILPHVHLEETAACDPTCISCTGQLQVDLTDFLPLALLHGKISQEGWLTYDNKLLLWIPPYLRNVFLGPHQMVISQNPLHKHVIVDWSTFVYGESWTNITG